MTVRDDHLATLLACVDEGTFDGAAAVLRITPSAVSQRVKALESTVGQLVLIRSVPVRPTEIGSVLLRSARQRALIAAELERELTARRSSAGVVDLPIAVNADSLATWFVEVLETVGRWSGVRLRIYIEDQDHSAKLLRDGSVVGAVTSSGDPVQGCSVAPLGTMRYLPLLRRDLWAQAHRDVTRVPMLRFNAHDDLQRRALTAAGLKTPEIEHVIGSAEGFAAAVRAGLGWGMVPEGLAEEGGALMLVPGLDGLDVPLYWQRWRLDTPVLKRLGDEVTAAAYRLR